MGVNDKQLCDFWWMNIHLHPFTSYFDVHKCSMVLNGFDPYPQNRYDIQDSFWGGDYSGGTSLDFWCFVTVFFPQNRP